MSYSQVVNLLHRLPTYKSISAVKINLRPRECRKPRECHVNGRVLPPLDGYLHVKKNALCGYDDILAATVNFLARFLYLHESDGAVLYANRVHLHPQESDEGFSIALYYSDDSRTVK